MAIRAARRSGLQPADVEDFSSVASLSILTKAKKLRRSFRGEAAVATFLHAVVRNCLRDYLISRFGKWRPSACARRLGVLACELEKLGGRDGLSDEEAFQVLRRSWHRPVGREEVERLARKLPPRVRRQRVAWTDEPAAVDDEGFESLEKPEMATRVESALRTALARLPPADLSLLRRHFVEGIPISRLARQLDVRQRALYSHKNRALRRLRRRLQAEGVDWPQVRQALEDSRVELYVGLLAKAGESRRGDRERCCRRPTDIVEVLEE